MAERVGSRVSNPVNTWPLVLMVIVPWSGYFHAPSSSPILALENTAVIFGLAFAALTLQQVAVALAARALGDRLLTFSIGIGPKLWSRSIAHHLVIVRAVPVNSLQTLITTRERGQRVRTALAIFAGWAPFAIGLVVIALFHPASWTQKYVVLAHRLAPDTLFIYVAGWLALNGALISLGTLTRSKYLSGLDDNILKSRRLVGHAFEVERLLTRDAYDQAIAAARRGLEEQPDDLLLQINLAAALSLKGDPEAFAITESWKTRDIPPHLRAGCLNVRAWECYMRNDDALRAEADEASLAAISASPDHPAILDTRGHVLLSTGRTAEAQQHLQRAFALSKGRSGKALSASGLAILHANAGRLDEAVAWLARARAQDLAHPLLAKAAALVEPLRRV
jgi:Flp pilus assembly protein TadD